MSPWTRRQSTRSTRLSTRRAGPAALALMTGAGLLLPALVPAAGAATRPDLRVVALSAQPRSVEAGGTLTVTDTTATVTAGRAGRSVTRFHLSRDRAWSRTDPRLGSRRVRELRGNSRQRATTTLTVPSTTAAREWYVVACADATRKVRESREGNNCRATSDPVTVTAPTAGTDFPLDPDPITVGSTLETGRAVSQWVNPHETNTLTATGSDGTTYTLTIPPGALLGPATIRMTPVATVSDLPLSGGLTAGVQLEPHGLALYAPVELEIDSPELGALSAQTPFLFHEDGEDFHLYPPAMPEAGDDADTVRMSLTHFSTPGVGLATPSDRAGVAQHPPVRTQAQAEQAVSSLLAAERASQQAGNPPNPDAMQQVVRVLESYYDQSVRPRLAAAESSTDITEAEAALLVSEALSLARQLSLLGQEDNPRVAEIMERIERIARAVMNAAWNDCLDHDLSTIEVLFRAARISALFGYAWQEEAMDKLRGCVRFEVRFEQTTSSTGSFSGTLQSGSHDEQFRMTSTVVVPFLDMNARAPLTHAAFSSFSSQTIHDADPDCTSTTQGTATTPGELLATAVPVVDPNVVESQAGAPPRQPGIMTSVTVPGTAQPKQTYLRTACDGSTSTYQDSRWHFHGPTEGLPVTLSPTLGEDLVGTHSKQRTVTTQGDMSTYDTRLEVWHKPKL